jgi:hypothetical protein
MPFVLATRTAHGAAGEHQIKAAMIYNMAKFTDWPVDSMQTDQFLICILGKGRLSKAVETLQGKPVRGRTIIIRSITQASEAANCQIVVLAESERKQFAALLGKTQQYQLMTISDDDGFAKAGGVVGFFVEEGKVRLEINATAAHRHKLRIDAQVLKLARIVQGQP